MDQNRLTGHIEVKGPTGQISAISPLEDTLVEQLTAAFETGPRSNKPQGPDAARHNMAA
jgi:hypothetical protein